MSAEELEYRTQYKRQKHSRACEFCRRRKVGCDAADRSDRRCSRCIANGIDCQYDPAAKMKRPTKKYVQALEDRLSKVESLLEKLRADAPLLEVDPDEAEDPPSQQSPPIVSNIPHPTWSSTTLFPRGFHPSTDSSEEIDPSDNEDGQAVTDTHPMGYQGKSSNSGLVRTVIGLKSKYTGMPPVEFNKPLHDVTKPFLPDVIAMASNIIPPYREKDFPPPDIMATLIDAYFVHLNTYLALLHRPTFERDVKSCLHLRDKGFGTVVLLVCATGSAWSSSALHLYPNKTPGWEWFDKVSSAAFSPLARPRLYDLQACALIAAYVNATSSPQGSSTVLSLGIRMAHDVGAHRKKMYSVTPTPEQELWKRAFWVLVAMDRLASFGLGRPCTIHDEDFDLDPMTECDDEYWSHPDASQAFKQPPGKPSTITFCNTFIRLLKIQAFASRTIYTINKSKLLFGYVGPEWKQSIVAELDSSMNKWLDTIPPHLRWDPKMEGSVFLSQSAILYANYYQLQIFIHRQFIPSPRRRVANANLSLPSMTICANAARACVRLLGVLHHRTLPPSGTIEWALTPLQLPLFTAAIMLVLSLWCGARDTQGVLEDVDICLDMLKDLEESGNFLARKVRAVLRAMVPVTQQPPSERSYSASSSTLAKEGAQTVEELLTAALEQLHISGWSPSPNSDGSDMPKTPTNGVSIHPIHALPGSTPTRHAGRLPAFPSPHSDSDFRPIGVTPQEAAYLNQVAFNVFSGCDGWALDLNTIRMPFARGTALSPTDAAGTDQAEMLRTPPIMHSLAGDGLAQHTTSAQSDPAIAVPSDIGSGSGGNAFMAADFDFLDSLSNLLGNIQEAPSLAAQHGPLPSAAPATTRVEPVTTCAPSELNRLPTAQDPTSWEAMNDGVTQDPGLWQWLTAPDGQLWDQWEAFVQDQGGAAEDHNQPASL